jgi:hypothetical protein
MDFNHTIQAVAVALQTHVPVLLEGAPGVAKTAIVSGILAQLCDETHTSIVALHEPPEYGGFPVPQAATEDLPARVALLPNDWVIRLAGAKRAGLFLDEFSSGAPATRAASMRGVHEKWWGAVQIQNLAVVAAMNPAEYAENGFELGAALANRFLHVNWDMPTSYWVDQLVSGFPIPTAKRVPEGWRESRHMRDATTWLAAFASARPAAIQALPESAAARAKAWPSYRSFTNARDLLAASLATGYGLDHPVTILTGAGASHEFLTFCSEVDLPDPEAVLADPASLTLPERGDRAFAVLTGVVLAVLANNTPQRWGRAWDVLAVAVKANRVAVAASAARSLAQARPKGVRELPKACTAFVPMLKAAGLIAGGK